MSIKKIAVLTSGGDSPGMNAAIRAVTRSAIYYNVEIFGVHQGYKGLIEGLIEPFHVRSVSKILGSGGTFLRSSRCPEFQTPEGRQKAKENLDKHGIDALIVIGGDGSLTGAHVFWQEHGIRVIGIPATIDNDLPNTEYTIGYDTASNVVTACIDKIRATANSHNRLFFVEVMGRNSGYIALRTGIATGAVCIMMPEKDISVEELIAILRKGYRNEKTSSIVIVAEGNKNGGAFEIANQVSEKYNDYETKVSILGHLQRGGDPTAFDRVLASELGVAAVEGLLEGYTDVMVGKDKREIKYSPIEECIGRIHELDKNLVKIAGILSI